MKIKCSYCSNEWQNSGKNIYKCPNCDQLVITHSSLRNKPHEILKDIVEACGVQVFSDRTRMRGILADVTQNKLIRKIILLAIDDNIHGKLLNNVNRDIKLESLKHNFTKQNLLYQETAYYIVDSFAYALEISSNVDLSKFKDDWFTEISAIPFYPESPKKVISSPSQKQAGKIETQIDKRPQKKLGRNAFVLISFTLLFVVSLILILKNQDKPIKANIPEKSTLPKETAKEPIVSESAVNKSVQLVIKTNDTPKIKEEVITPLSAKSLEDYFQLISDSSIPYEKRVVTIAKIINDYFENDNSQVVELGNNNSEVSHAIIKDFLDELSLQPNNVEIIKDESNTNKKITKLYIRQL